MCFNNGLQLRDLQFKSGWRLDKRCEEIRISFFFVFAKKCVISMYLCDYSYDYKRILN